MMRPVIAPLAAALVMLTGASAEAAAPTNDAFAAAQQLSGTSASAPGTTVEATLEPGEPPHSTTGNGSVWYSWTAPQNLILTIGACDAAFPVKLQLWVGSTVSSLTEVPPRSDSSGRCPAGSSDSRVFNVSVGTTYAISAIEANGFSGDTAFTLTLAAAPGPANDDFAAPQDLGQQLNVDVDGTTAGATMQPGEDDAFGGTGDGGSVWYRWTAPMRMRVWIDNCNAASNSTVTVYTGGSVDSVQPVGENFGNPQAPGCEGGGIFGGRSEFEAISGKTYMIRVYSPLREAGSFHLRMREVLYDGALSQSASKRSVKKGKKVTYTIDVENRGTLPIDPWVVLVTSKPDQLAKSVAPTKYLSIKTTKGSCERVKFFVEHPGAVCKFGELAPGESLQIVAKVRPSQSLSHWIFLDYGHGEGDGAALDDNESNNPARSHVTTKVKRGGGA